MKRGRTLAIPLGPRTRLWWLRATIVLLALFALDLAFPPPLNRAYEVSPVVLDREGGWLRAFTTPNGKWRLAARLNEIDPEFVRRLITVEDRHFWIHPGVDPLALTRATASWARSGQITSGGSTLTMQLARLIEPRPRTIGSKLIEIVRAAQIERRLSKRQILSAYLTVAPYGGNLEGVRAASRAYFGRDPQGLSDADMALLIALPQAPEARRPDRRADASRRARDRVLDKFVRLGLTSRRLAAEARQTPPPGRTAFPVAADRVAAGLVEHAAANGVVRSTIDARLQAALERLVHEQLDGVDPQTSAAILVVEVKNRQVRAAVSGDGPGRAGAFLDMTEAVRSPGSSLKPFIYGLALDDGIAAPETLIDDRPRRFDGYLPENFDKRFHGQVRLYEALQHSLNLPAVATLQKIGPARFEAALTTAGARPRFPRRKLSEPGLALALGGVGLTLREITTLYAALGDGGAARPLLFTQDETRGRSSRLMKPESAAKILGILANSPSPAGRAPTTLIEGAPKIAFKTGTSYGFRDAWAFGVGAGFAVGVWVGRPDGAPRPDETGRAAALPILFSVFDVLGPTGATPMTPFEPKARVAGGQKDLDPDLADMGPVMVFPPDGAELLVTEFGGASRGVSLAARGGAGPLVWFAEGARVAEDSGGKVIWRPSGPGFHEVMVVDAMGRRARAHVRVREN